ncbi:hypothetical protein FAGAP_7484 [Fusarium agapanthi]|uniref:RING-type domain-containing protein n=1 Tax=Fusarium agapanthi TaxID=1803897 RepID=A0A9P5B7I2_9HYPO|nr:hypothetical protein FAGAP_7484 [Fusarium agapanthi]
MSPPSKPLPEAFWPTIKNAIDKGSNTNSDNQAITPQCPICMEPLPVKSFPAEGELDAEVLLCGHVLCQPCRQQWERSNLGDRCPACRTTLYCSRCEVNSIPLTIPKNGEGSSLPPGLPEGTQDLCPDCQAEFEFHRAVEDGEWPHNLDDMEPGFVSLFYHVVNDIEKDGNVATEMRVQDAITDTIMQEFDNMMVSRRMVTLGRGNTLRQTNPWYAENSKRQENRRHGIVGFDSDDDEEPRANTPAGVPYPIRNPFILGAGDRHVHQPAPLHPQPGDFVRGRLANNPLDHRRYANPFDVQDGIAPPNAVTQTARSAQDDDRQAPDAGELRRWAVFLQRNSSPAAAEAARPAAPRNFQEAFDYADANAIASLTDSIGQELQQLGDNLGGVSATRRATRRATGEPESAPGAPEPPAREVARASTAAGSMAHQSRSAAPSAASQTARPARNYPEGSASAMLAQYRPMFHRLEQYFTRPADMPSFDEIVDDANAYEAAHANDPDWIPRTRAEYLAEHEEHMRRIVANRTVASSSSPASGVSQYLSSMDLDDSDEDMLSADQPVSQR